MAQGTDSVAAWKIAEGGFGLVTSDTDPGWFGKGFFIILKFLSKKKCNHFFSNRNLFHEFI